MRAASLGWCTIGVSAVVAATACQSTPGPVFTPHELRSEVAARAGEFAPREIAVPYVVAEDAIERTRREVEAAEPGAPRVLALVDLLAAPPPRGFGLRYRGALTLTASETLERGEGNCVSLASVLVGLARGLGWRAYFAEAGELRDEAVPDSPVGVRADHMVVVVVADGEVQVVDFLGTKSKSDVHVIDDVDAYAHFVNNRGFERILRANREQRAVPWQRVHDDFALATAVSPSSARAWNNLGIALARLGRDDEARIAYLRARQLDDELSSAERNLGILETRSAVEPPAHDAY